MTSQQPPRIATWMLERFCADPALLGDLMEEYGSRSNTWYWRQAIVAASVYPFSQIVAHKWLAIRAIVTGYVIWYVFNVTLLKGVLRPWLGMDSTLDRAWYFLIMYAIWMANGWVIAKLHRPYSSAMLLAYVLWAIVASVPPVYTAVMSAVSGMTGGTAIAWEVFARVATLVTVMIGGVLSIHRDQIRQTRTAAQDWRPGSPRAFAAR